jgi:hypothetical protein
MRHRGAELVGKARDHFQFPLHHGLEADLGDLSGAHLLGRPDMGVRHIGAIKEIRFRGARHQTGDRDTPIFQLVAECDGEGVQERLGPVVDRLEGAWHETRDGARDENATLPAAAHVAGAPGRS